MHVAVWCKRQLRFPLNCSLFVTTGNKKQVVEMLSKAAKH